MNTREEIIHFLQQHPYACAEELGTILGKTRANIQHHLKLLEQSQIISQVSISPTRPGRGRPRAYFSLTQVKRSNNYLSLLESLLKLVLELEDDSALEASLEKIARHILPPSTIAATLTQRLSRTMKELSKSGYQARWEAHADGPQVVFRNCPYHPLADKFPILCQMDALLLMKDLGVAAINQIEKIQFPGVPSCRFIIKEN